MVDEAGEIVEHLAAVLALVDLVTAVCLDVRAQVVAAGIPLPADVAGERFLAGVNPHVTPKVRGPDESVAAHFAHKGPLRFPLILLGFGLQLLKTHNRLPPDLHLRLHKVDELQVIACSLLQYL